MSLPFDPERIYEYEWSVLGLTLTFKGGDAMIISRAKITEEILKVVEPRIGPPPWA